MFPAIFRTAKVARRIAAMPRISEMKIVSVTPDINSDVKAVTLTDHPLVPAMGAYDPNSLSPFHV